MAGPTQTGTIGWIDMTTENAAQVRDFYTAIVGWDSEDLQMDGYADFVMKPPGGQVLVDPRGLAGGRFCVIKDPGGAVAALYQS
jgi:predicted enzyme related to lactoylglutathione lyase